MVDEEHDEDVPFERGPREQREKLDELTATFDAIRASGWLSVDPEMVDVQCGECGLAAQEYSRFAVGWLCEPCRAARAKNEAERERFEAWVSVIDPRQRDCAFGMNAHLRIGAKQEDVLRAKQAAIDLRSIVIQGAPGAGKTSLAAALLRSIYDVHRGKSVVWASTLEIVAACDGHPRGAGDPPVVREAMRSRLLVLDDLGQEAIEPKSPIRRIMFARTAKGLPTWITTGFDAAAIATMYGGGMLRRVYEIGETIALFLPRKK